jgi:trehalose 6-phosphate phosphatase
MSLQGGGSVRSRRSRRLWDNWKNVGPRLRSAERIALFLDFDGTLAPICSHPEQVQLDSSTRRLLARLARHPLVAVYVVSGRRVADVRKRVRVSKITYLGLHGWERENGMPKETETRRFIQHLRSEVEARLVNLEGVWVEDKFLSLVVHYRRASPRARRMALAALRKVLARVRSRVRVLNGKKVWEVLPLEIKGKGAAVRALLKLSRQKMLPIYLGDDTTDEAAFEALPRGITVRVGTPRRTKAHYELSDPDDVRKFLEKLEVEIS